MARAQGECFGCCAAIVPQHGRSQGPVVLTQQHRSVHLAGEADRANAGHGRRLVAGEPVEQCGRGVAPRIGILLGPIRPRARDGQRRLVLGQHRLRAVDEHDFHG